MSGGKKLLMLSC